MRTRPPHGFTLIELMIVVAIVAILAMVAMPAYDSYIRRSVRVEAQGYMQTVASRQAQFLVDTRAYANATQMAAAVPVPARVAAAYTVTLPAPQAAPPAYTLTLTPTGRQTADTCGTLAIDQAGRKTATYGNAAVTGCW